tara:strand:- start:4104 stop:4268 length:165 start_codon:yes stop_codon:yes gene_type:complete
MLKTLNSAEQVRSWALVNGYQVDSVEGLIEQWKASTLEQVEEEEFIDNSSIIID